MTDEFLPQSDLHAEADALWNDITSSNDPKRSAALGRLLYAADSVRDIVLQRSGEAAARFYASPEGQEEWEEQADWRALDSEPVFDDEDETEGISSVPFDQNPSVPDSGEFG